MALTAAYDNNEAQVCMTLAAIAYSGENVPTSIQQAITTNLANTAFATGGNWKLVWLGLTSNNENFAYVAQNTTQPAQYAIAIRGTDWCFPTNLQEDFSIFTQSAPGFGPSGALAADGAINGLTDITTVSSAPIAGGNAVTLGQYLQNQYNAGGFTTFDVFVTGHSLGGCLASITFPWLVNEAANWNGGGKSLNAKAYTFAAPSAGNADFASYVTGLSKSGPYYYWSVVNPRDLAPQAWSNLINVIPQGIVVRVGLKLGLELILLISAVITELQQKNVTYVQPGSANQHVLTNDLDFSSTCGTAPVTTFGNYFCWVGKEHGGDTYLTLLGATPTNITNANDCPAPTPPTVTAAAEADPVVQQQLAQLKQNLGE